MDENNSGVYKPKVIPSRPFPNSIIADNVRNPALNTQTRNAKGLLKDINFPTTPYRATGTIQKTGGHTSDVVGSEITFTLERPLICFASFFANVWIQADDALRTYYIRVFLDIDGVSKPEFAEITTGPNFGATEQGGCLAIIVPYKLEAGEHTIKMKWTSFAGASDVTELRARGLDATILGF